MSLNFPHQEAGLVHVHFGVEFDSVVRRARACGVRRLCCRWEARNRRLVLTVAMPEQYCAALLRELVRGNWLLSGVDTYRVFNIPESSLLSWSVHDSDSPRVERGRVERGRVDDRPVDLRALDL